MRRFKATYSAWSLRQACVTMKRDYSFKTLWCLTYHLQQTPNLLGQGSWPLTRLDASTARLQMKEHQEIKMATIVAPLCALTSRVIMRPHLTIAQSSSLVNRTCPTQPASRCHVATQKLREAGVVAVWLRTRRTRALLWKRVPCEPTVSIMNPPFGNRTIESSLKRKTIVMRVRKVRLAVLEEACLPSMLTFLQSSWIIQIRTRTNRQHLKGIGDRAQDWWWRRKPESAWTNSSPSLERTHRRWWFEWAEQS